MGRTVVCLNCEVHLSVSDNFKRRRAFSYVSSNAIWLSFIFLGTTIVIISARRVLYFTLTYYYRLIVIAPTQQQPAAFCKRHHHHHTTTFPFLEVRSNIPQAFSKSYVGASSNSTKTLD